MTIATGRGPHRNARIQMEQPNFNPAYPTVDDLRNRARRRVPKFAFDYLDGGCNEDVNLRRNRDDVQAVELVPQYLSGVDAVSTRTELFGKTYDAPFGVAPIGLQGLVWPHAGQILAEAATEHNVPFILSTVSTAGIEQVAKITDGQYWFQLYHPARPEVRDDILRRVSESGCPVLVLLADVPSFGFRPRDIRNGLSMPPRMSLRNVLQILSRPTWAFETLRAGKPSFKSLEPYMSGGLDLKGLGCFMNEMFSGRLDRERIAPIRDRWRGKLVLKGVLSEEDAQQALELGFDGIIVSNHGGRQLDAGQSSIVPMTSLAKRYGDQLKVMVDSGLQSGPDVARAVASGAAFTFMGRSFMYGVGALGKGGGMHTMAILKAQLRQVMEQLGCAQVADLPRHVASRSGGITAI